MNKYLKESVLWVLNLLPYIYLIINWNQLPSLVPTHFNLEGVADDWSGKNSLVFIPCGFGVGIYFLMLIIPVLDPKKKIQQMGEKYYSLRLMLAFFFSLLAIYLLYASKAGSFKNSNMLFALIGILFAMLGNYFQAVRPNYFIGIRTPWTLENEKVWKKTHQLAGRLWMMGGIVIAILSFVMSNPSILGITFGSLVFIMVIIPVVFSYIEFRKEKNMSIHK